MTKYETELRDRFAVAVIPTLLEREVAKARSIVGASISFGQAQALAAEAFTIADAMLAERARREDA